MDLDFVVTLYHRFSQDLARVREIQRRLHAQRGDVRLERFTAYRVWSAVLSAIGLPAHYKRRIKPQLDDIESEITYLLVRASRPQAAVEIAPDRGWSTTWILQALRDNGTGRLYSCDLFDHSSRAVPRDLAEGRWTFVQGDVTRGARGLERLPSPIDFLFLDAAHSVEFARWYLAELVPRLGPGTPVAIHDIFPVPEKADRMGESAIVQAWLEQRHVPYLTASPTAAPAVYDRLMSVKRELDLAAPVHWSTGNPMVFFRTP